MIIGALIAMTLIGLLACAALFPDGEIVWGRLVALSMVLIPVCALIGRAFQ